ncbi:MAG TPA: peptidase S10 [Xanthomonadales bacterium]|nr:peptidase S10 [Xanthomonadales bacterium]
MKKLIMLVCTLMLAIPALADGEEGEGATKDKGPKPEAKSSVTKGSVRIDGQNIEYTATAGWLIMENDEGEPIARFGYTAYTRDGIDAAERPIMFAFNGGPGSSSIWLHMGILGPQRVIVNDGGFAPPPPAERVANEYSIIDVTDLVMVDPVGTGFSKPIGEGKGEDFWGVDQDIQSVGAFVKKYVTENHRWASPKYILGESYGGIRSAGLVWHMQNQHSMNFNGVVMVSPFLNMGSGIDGTTLDMPHVLYLSTLASTAWYHDMIPNKPADLAAFVEEVDQFAYNEYAPALMKGYTIDESEKAEIAARLAGYTGTDVDYWMKADLRVSHQQFTQELMRDNEKIAGRIDSRFVGPSVNPLGESMDYDPFFPSVGPAFTAGFFDYMHADLNFGHGEEYIVSGGVGGQWDWEHSPPSSGAWVIPWADLRPDLSMAMTMNPGLHLLVQQGYYDLATPIGATRHDISHLDISAEARERITMEYYEAGHMMYLHQPSLEKYREDLANFVRETDRL